MENLLTVKEAAALLKYSPKRVRQLCLTRKLRARKPGRDWRIEAHELRKWIDSNPTNDSPDFALAEALNGRR